jgi:hypothetical protein
MTSFKQFLFFLILSIASFSTGFGQTDALFEKEKARVLRLAEVYKNLDPITVSASFSPRSAGGKNDFYSEGDYWWPNPDDPDGPYIRRDGLTNPDNFTAHREAMIRFSQISGALGSAYLVSGKEEYGNALIPHLRAWFIEPDTRMNPNLLYGQAIKGVLTGRGIGIIDTIHLMEVAKAVQAIASAESLNSGDLIQIKAWFSDYLNWIFTHPYGIAERDNGNNHSVSWAMQAAVFAELVGNDEVLTYCREMYKTQLLPDQMAADGSFPLELARTKPYGYSLFTLDAMTTICQVLSTPEENLFEFKSANGRSIGLGISFLSSYVKDKSTWSFPKDVMYWEEWPVRHPFLLFGGMALDEKEYLNLWASLDGDFDNPEVVRNMPVRFPLLWVERVEFFN